MVVTKTKRKRRTAEQRIADLQQEIEWVKSREAARKAKDSPESQATFAAARALNVALAAASEAGEDELTEALTEARTTVKEQLDAMGLAMPVRRKGRGKKAE